MEVMIMKTTDVRCPVCGSMNKKLYLEETGGSMECDCCGSTVLLRKTQDNAHASEKAFFWQIVRTWPGTMMAG